MVTEAWVEEYLDAPKDELKVPMQAVHIVPFSLCNFIEHYVSSHHSTAMTIAETIVNRGHLLWHHGVQNIECF